MGLATIWQPSAAVTEVMAGAAGDAGNVVAGDGNKADGAWPVWGAVVTVSASSSTPTSYVLPSKVILNIFMAGFPF